MHALRFTAGPLAGRRVEVTSALVLGRQAADLVIEDPQVSRRHASVRPAGDTLEVEGSAVRATPTEASPQPDPPPALPFRPSPQRPPRRRSGVASRRLTPTVLSFGTVVVTAIALVWYFAMR